MAVLGGELWLATDPGPTIPTPYIYHWSAGSRKPNESWEAFVRRANEEGKEYVRSFRWDDKDTAHKDSVPYFNITAVTESELETPTT